MIKKIMYVFQILLICLFVAVYYCIQLLIISVLLWFSIGSFQSGRLNAVFYGFFTFLAAGYLLWDLFFKKHPADVQGISVTSRNFPHLYQEIADIAGILHMKIPDRIILTNDMGAYVIKENQIFGLGGKTIIAIGLPLITMLNISQFRAVVGHEFGHSLAEKALITSLKSIKNADKLKPIEWHEVLNIIYIPSWRLMASKHLEFLELINIKELSALARNVAKLVEQYQQIYHSQQNKEEIAHHISYLIGSAISLSAIERKLPVTTLPGGQIQIQLQDLIIDPFLLMRYLAGNRIDSVKWDSVCTQLDFDFKFNVDIIEKTEATLK